MHKPGLFRKDVASPWISVTDRLPEQEVYVFASDGEKFFAAFMDGRLWESGEGWDAEINLTVTYWMPIPELPSSPKPL